MNWLLAHLQYSSPDWRHQHISGPTHKFPLRVFARARIQICSSNWCFGWKNQSINQLKKKKKRKDHFSQGQAGHVGTATSFQQPSLPMQSLPAECPASLLGEPGGVGHTWLRDASCAPPSVLLLSSEQQTVKWEEEVETRDFLQSLLRAAPQQPSEETVGPGSQTTAMRGQWCREGRDGRVQSQQQLYHVQSVSLLPSTPVEMDISCCHSPERLWNGFQTSREPPNWLRFQVVTRLQEMHPWLLFAPDVWLYPLISLEGEAGSELILSRDGRENSLWAETSESAHCFPLSFLPLM